MRNGESTRQRLAGALLIAATATIAAACTSSGTTARPSAHTTTAAPHVQASGPTRTFWTESRGGTSTEPGDLSSAVDTRITARLVTGIRGGGGVAANSTYVYWAGAGSGSIGRAELDGSHADRRFITGADHPVGIAVDQHHVYWTSLYLSHSDEFEQTISRANLDGTHVQRHFIVAEKGEAAFVTGLAVDGGHIYWSDLPSGTIGRASLDGTHVDRTFITGASSPTGVAVGGSYLFWSNGEGNSIGRADRAGTAVIQRCIVPTGLPVGNQPEGVASDGAYVYWTNYPGNTVARAHLDGTAIEPAHLHAGGVPGGVAVIPPRPVARPASKGCTGSAPPILLGVRDGGPGPFASGWGAVAPAVLSNGGASANGSVYDIVWSSWGGPVAEGRGKNPIYKPEGGYYEEPAVMELRASNPRRCKAGGPVSYTKLETRVQSSPGGPFGAWHTDAPNLCKDEGI